MRDAPAALAPGLAALGAPVAACGLGLLSFAAGLAPMRAAALFGLG